MKIVENFTDLSLECLDSLPEDIHLLDKASICVAKPESLISNLDYFLQRKNRVIMLVNEMDCNKTLFRFINGDTGIEDIIKTVKDILSNSKVDTASGDLSPREIEVLKELAAGKTQKEIADHLCISATTVVTHRKNISSKLGIRSISGLALYAAMKGYI